MKVYQLMSAIESLPANAEVLAQDNVGGWACRILELDTDSMGDENPILIWDESEIQDEDADDA